MTQIWAKLEELRGYQSIIRGKPPNGADKVKIVVAGGRNFADYAKLSDALDYWMVRLGISIVVTGGGVTYDPAEHGKPVSERRRWGADFLAAQWAESRRIPVLVEPITDEEFKKLDRGATPIRNRRLLDKHKPERVIDFGGGEDTVDLLNQARAAGIRCIEVA